jgi:protein involved in polysaccharide export with SLBB domain
LANFPRQLVLCVLIVALFYEPACPQVVSSADRTKPSDLIHLGDLIDVDVLGSLEYDWRGTLTPEGFLDGLDQVEKQIYALCRTEAEVAAEITAEYARILRDPKVIVKILDRSNRALAIVDGAVRNPQRLRILRPVRLHEVLVITGGLTDDTSGEIRIQRPEGLSCGERSTPDPQSNGPRIIDIKITDILRGDPESNPYIVSGDIINVLEAFPVYVIGAVNRPGKIDSRVQLTLSRAVSIAGGLARNSDDGKVTVYRREGGETVIFNVSIAGIQASESEDLKLRAFDIVEVEEKGRARRRFPPDLDLARRRVRDRSGGLPIRTVD